MRTAAMAMTLSKMKSGKDDFHMGKTCCSSARLHPARHCAGYVIIKSRIAVALILLILRSYLRSVPLSVA